MLSSKDQIRILVSIGLIALAVTIIVIAFKDSGRVTFNNGPSKDLYSVSSFAEPENSVVYSTGKTYSSVDDSEDEDPEDDSVAFPININTADVETLTHIPGIGETKAAEIVAYREANGKFSCAEDLLNVYGIGEATLEKIYGYITV